MKEIAKEHVILLHDDLIKTTGGELGILNEGILESALNSPFQSYGEIDFFPTTLEKAAKLSLGVINNHAFVDGNKRTGILVMQSYLFQNGFDIVKDNEKLEELGVEIASGKINYDGILEWLKENTLNKNVYAETETTKSNNSCNNTSVVKTATVKLPSTTNNRYKTPADKLSINSQPDNSEDLTMG